MNDQLNVEEKERLQQGLRILGRMIARAHLRSLGYPAGSLYRQPEAESPHEDANEKLSKSTSGYDDVHGKSEDENGSHFRKQHR